MSNIRMELTDQLRKNRNDLIFLSSNLYIPEDANNGPELDKLDLDTLVRPKWIRVIEIPTNTDGMSDIRSNYVRAIDKAENLIDAALGIINMDEYDKFSSCALDIAVINQLMDYINKTFNSIADLCAIVPDNRNYYLTRLVAYVNQLYGYCHPAIVTMSEYINDYYGYLYSSDIPSANEWLTMFDNTFENGIYCVSFDFDIMPLVRDAMVLFSKWMVVLSKTPDSSNGSYKNSELMAVILKAQTSLNEVISKNFDLAHSRMKLKEFPYKNSNSENSREFIPKLPYDYVHQRYYVKDNVEDEVINEMIPHIMEHMFHRIGDILV